MPKQLLTPNEATVLVAMPDLTTMEYWLCRHNRFDPRATRRAMLKLFAAGLVARRGERLTYPHGISGRGVATTMWTLTNAGERRRTELLGFEQAVTTLIGSAARSGGVGDRFLADADVRPGPSRAMYPASVLQGRGG